MFKAPSGDLFRSKADYQHFMGNNARQKGKVVVSIYEDRKGNHTGSVKRKAKCPKCQKSDNLTRDWYGNLMCPACYLLSL